mmetsp:Transcript_22556/g.33746  ORF Transcript_22556/g.33746 Transcript_22556/m.33746 type:complete len:100 (+) Transcript_22556:256-555(+)
MIYVFSQQYTLKNVINLHLLHFKSILFPKCMESNVSPHSSVQMIRVRACSTSPFQTLYPSELRCRPSLSKYFNSALALPPKIPPFTLADSPQNFVRQSM